MWLEVLLPGALQGWPEADGWPIEGPGSLALYTGQKALDFSRPL